MTAEEGDLMHTIVPQQKYPKATEDEIYEEYVKTQQGKEGVLEPSVDSTESEEEEIVRVAFDRPFQDPSDLSESGTGKSKLLKNFAESRMTVYCCLHESKSSSYPSRSHISNILLHEFENERDAIVTYLAYICACCQRLEEFNGSCKEWFDEHTNKKLQMGFWKNVEYRMSDIMHGLMKNPTDSKMTEWITNYLDGGKLMWESSVNCLFAFDEACSLVDKNIERKTLFYYVQCALKLLPKKLGIFAIFTDTHSKISNFSPVSYLDPSIRDATKGSKLFEPFYLLDTVDMNTMNTAFKKALTLQDDAEGFNPERIIELAMDKLIGGKSFIHWKTEAQTKISIMEALAIFGPHLYCECITTSMPTEPVLAEAATRMMNDPNVSLAELIGMTALKRNIHVVWKLATIILAL
ncbi:1920_t:CDS:2 [Paraglomus brasilianum]|uniref:1920_t:CDS:1 n=1 Tax=Paraglomus brasilianum TaxID=144538 RepID=A0A9N9DFL2_9GLOM|nr:1920_t:CDS:2 [Paraglomus brasilianum]